MEQRLCIKILREEYHKAKEIGEQLIQHFGIEDLSYSEACDWRSAFARAMNKWKMHKDRDDP
jgi:hypothetical protein